MTAPTPPSLSALVECKRLIDAYDKWDGVMTIGARDARTEMERACTAYVRSLPQSGICHDCENKKLREVLSAPRPDVSLGEASLIEAVCRAYCAHNGWDADEPVTYSGTRSKAHNMDGSVAVQWQMHTDDAEFYLSALRAQSPAEGGWLPIESAPRDGTKVLILHKGNQQPIISWVTDADVGYFKGSLWQQLPKAPTAIALRESQAEGKS